MSFNTLMSVLLFALAALMFHRQLPTCQSTCLHDTKCNSSLMDFYEDKCTFYCNSRFICHVCKINCSSASPVDHIS